MHERTTPAAPSPPAPRSPRVFISYSRSDTPLVEELYANLQPLERFLDFRSLVPGSPWEPQLQAALADADVFVLVVSERSVWTSQSTRNEVRDAVTQGKRILLAIAERVPLPAELAEREWVDLRTGSFEERCGDLRTLIASPAQPPAVRVADAPDPGPPAPVRRAARYARVASVLSLPLIWTIVLPAILLPLPTRVRGRRFVLSTVRIALISQTVALLLLSSLISQVPALDGYVQSLLMLAVVVQPVFVLRYLRRPNVRRWMEPSATRPPRRRRPPSSPEPDRGIDYWIDAAGEDEAFIWPIVRVLHERGHQQHNEVGHLEPGDVPAGGLVLRFVSKFNDTSATISHATTIPIMLSDPDDDLPAELAQVQWLDFREGVGPRRKPFIVDVARGLGTPEVVLARLGTAPPHRIQLLPQNIRFLHDVLVLAAFVVAVSALAVTIRGSGPAIAIAIFVLASGAYVLIAAWSTSVLAQRRAGRIGRALVALVALGAILWMAGAFAVDFENDDIGLTIYFGAFLTVCAVALVALRAAFDLSYWIVPTSTYEEGTSTLAAILHTRPDGSALRNLVADITGASRRADRRRIAAYPSGEPLEAVARSE